MQVCPDLFLIDSGNSFNSCQRQNTAFHIVFYQTGHVYMIVHTERLVKKRGILETLLQCCFPIEGHLSRHVLLGLSQGFPCPRKDFIFTIDRIGPVFSPFNNCLNSCHTKCMSFLIFLSSPFPISLPWWYGTGYVFVPFRYITWLPDCLITTHPFFLASRWISSYFIVYTQK